MLSKEEFETLINNLREKLDETSSALVSEEILAALSAYNNGVDEYATTIEEMNKLKNEKEELLKVNGKLYQQIGFEPDTKNNSLDESEEIEEKIDISDVIDEKGDLI